MGTEDFFPVGRLCELYNLEFTFFQELGEIGLIEINSYEGEKCIHREELLLVEKIIRIHRDLQINLEGIDVVLNMLRKQEAMEAELLRLTNKLRRYDDHF